MNIREQFLFLRKGGEVRRFHTHRRIKEENVAEHSFGVAWIVRLLLGADCSAGVLLQALVHDVAEQETGDIPAPFKRSLGIRAQISDAEEDIIAEYELPLDQCTEVEKYALKLADALDGMASCLREAEMGNKLLDNIFLKYNDYVMESISGAPTIWASTQGISERANELRSFIIEQWELT